MADVILTITLKDLNGNLNRVLDLVDAIFPGRKTETKKDWIQKEIKQWIIYKIREYELAKGASDGKAIEAAKPDPLFE